MPREIRMTHATALVLRAVASGSAYGFDVMDATGLPSGTVYPALRRMERAGWLRASWEEGVEPGEVGRPRRRLYRLTAAGSEALSEADRRLRALERILPALGGEAGGS